MDFVITLCDTPRGQECPDFGDMAVTAAWPLPDPAKFTGSPVERVALLNELYASLRRRIDIFTALPFASLDRMALKARLDELAGAACRYRSGAADMRIGINGMGRIRPSLSAPPWAASIARQMIRVGRTGSMWCISTSSWAARILTPSRARAYARVGNGRSPGNQAAGS